MNNAKHHDGHTIQPITISLTTCRALYERHFECEMPGNLPYEDAARLVKTAMADDEAFYGLARRLEAEVNPVPFWRNPDEVTEEDTEQWPVLQRDFI